MKKIIIGAIIVLVLALIGSAGSGGSSSSSSSGRYGRGSSYDDNVDYAANQFGESADHVNDVYNALGGMMR